jgi:hypothetical protein
MGHLIVSFVLFAIMIMVTAVIFGVWLVVVIFRFFIRLFVGPAPRPIRNLSCGNPQCLATHPTNANFCRRCGRRLVPEVCRIPMRRAAMW